MFSYSLTHVLLALTALHSVNTDASSVWGLGKSEKNNIGSQCLNILIALLIRKVSYLNMVTQIKNNILEKYVVDRSELWGLET